MLSISSKLRNSEDNLPHIKENNPYKASLRVKWLVVNYKNNLKKLTNGGVVRLHTNLYYFYK